MILIIQRCEALRNKYNKKGTRALWKNHKILLTDIKEDLIKWRKRPGLWIRGFNIVNMSILL